MTDVIQKPDTFQHPQTFINPAIKNIFRDDTFLENCINFSFFKPFGPVERLIPNKPTRNVQFQFRDLNAFVNPKRFYLFIKFHCEKSDGSALSKSDFTSTLNPPSHSLIETFSLNVGQCEIFRINQLYYLLAKLYFLNDCSDQARKTFRKFFEGYEPDINSEVQNDISKCFDELNGEATAGPANSPQGRIAESIIDKKELFFIFQLHSPLETFQSLLLNDIDIGMR